MLIVLNKPFRLRAAGFLVALYSLCALAPAAAVAFNGQVAPCMTDTHGVAQVHLDRGDLSDRHSDALGDDPAEPGQCCGVLCFSALAPVAQFDMTTPILASALGTVSEYSFAGRNPDRLDRPPRSLSSF
jgi:hypothetical protein